MTELMAALLPLLEAIGWTLVHSLWQFGLIALVIYIVLGKAARAGAITAAQKYRRLALGLLTGVIVNGATFYYQFNDYQLSTKQQANFAGYQYLQPLIEGQLQAYGHYEFARHVNGHMHWLAIAWLIGVAFYLARYTMAQRHCQWYSPQRPGRQCKLAGTHPSAQPANRYCRTATGIKPTG